MSKETNKKITKKQKEKALEELKTQIYLNNMFYKEWLDDSTYTEDNELIKERIEPLKDFIKSFDIETRLLNNILNNDCFLYLLAHVDFLNEDISVKLTDDEIYDLASEYDKINDFFKENGDNAFNVYEKYGIITKKYGEYDLDDVIIEIGKDNEIQLDNEEQEKTFKSIVSSLYEDRTQLPNNDLINKASEEQNGINLKYFMFCEEYIKRGKIKPTCDYLGISRNTAYLWLEKEEVKKYLEDRQNEIKRETDDTFKNTYNSCFDELNKMVNSSYIQTGDKIKAIDTFLKHYENIERLKQPLTTSED